MLHASDRSAFSTRPVKAAFCQPVTREMVIPLTRELTGTHDDGNGSVWS